MTSTIATVVFVGNVKLQAQALPYPPAPDWVTSEESILINQLLSTFANANTSRGVYDAANLKVALHFLACGDGYYGHSGKNPLWQGVYDCVYSAGCNPPTDNSTNVDAYKRGYSYGQDFKNLFAYMQGFRDGYKSIVIVGGGQLQPLSVKGTGVTYLLENGWIDWNPNAASEATSYWKGYYDGSKIQFQMFLMMGGK